MSIRLNQKVIAGNYERRPVSYRYVGEIFQSAIPITDKKVACLDGKKIYSGEGYDSFIQYLTSQSLLYPQLVCTEEIWQEKVEQYGSWGQFVINTQENSVRLPKIAGFVQGLNTLEDLAGLLEAGLPNIEGKFWDLISSYGISIYNGTTMGEADGAFYTKAFEGTNDCATITANGSKLSSDDGIGFDASRSSAIYGNSTTVQPQAIQYPYYIVLATGVIQEINVKNEVELNNPFFLGMSEYFETEPNNLSWLKSDNQWYNGSVYESFYEWLINSYNEGNENVKLVTEEYDDYNFVINKEEGTFRLPLLDGSESIFSDKYIDLTYAGHGVSYTAPANGWYNILGYGSENAIWLKNNSTRTYNSAPGFIESVSNTGVFIPCKKGDEVSAGYYNGTVSQFRFVYAKGNGSLYYYVGETIQNVNIINTSKLIEKVEGVNNKYKSQITNCVTEIPQRIKLELNNGVLTLKAGSTVIVPNGFEEDGVTPKFDYITVENNSDWYPSSTAGTRFGYYSFTQNTLANSTIQYTYSGNTATMNGITPQVYTFFYNTETNKIYNGSDGAWVVCNISLPICLFKNDSTATVTSLDQVFNGIGYMGSTIWCDKGVKCLVPNGRNEDGTLNNIEVTTNKLQVLTNPHGASPTGNSALGITPDGTFLVNHRYIESETEPSIINYTFWYKPSLNTTYYGESNKWGIVNSLFLRCFVAYHDYIYDTNTKINTFTGIRIKQSFRALDYSDKPKVSAWALPSNKYIDLTLGASGSSYTAPANGWVVARIKAGSTSSFLQLNNPTTVLQDYSNINIVGFRASGMLPVQKGQVFSFGYGTNDTVEIFRFIYAEGEV